MSYEVYDTSRVAQTVGADDKITEIDGEPVDFYIKKLKPFGHQKFAPARLISPTPIKIAPFVSMGANGVPTYGTEYEAKADVHLDAIMEFDKDQGKLIKKAEGRLNFKHVRGDHNRKFLAVFLSDELSAKAFESQYTVVYQKATYAGSGFVGHKGTVTYTPKAIIAARVELKDGLETEDGIKLVNGMAMVKIGRDQITRAEILDPNSHFEISVNGETPVVYRAWNGGEFCIEQTHHFHVYLTRALG